MKPPGWLARTIVAGLPGLVGLFMGSMAIGILGLKVDGPPLVGLLIRGSLAVLLGGIAAWLLAVAVQGVRGPGRRRPRVPAVLLARCAGCGLPIGPSEGPCPLCGHPAPGRETLWTASRGPEGAELGVPVGIGLVGLGVFMMTAPFVDGDRRVWVVVGCLALGLLMSGMGALFTFGGLSLVYEWLLGRGTWSYRAEIDSEVMSSEVTVEAEITRAGLSAKGHLEERDGVLPGRVVRPVLPTLSDPERAFVSALASLHDTGRVCLARLRVIDWRLDPARSGPPTYTRVITTSIEAHLVGESDRARHPLVPFLLRPRPVAAIWAEVRENPAVLRHLAHDSGVDETDPVVQVLALEVAAQAVH
ncbi:MAG: hypothetical protein Q8P41_05660 [Pseudomonadota bacterium]|nr:hypothetical protein [Pseudomonadota bacterium]